VRDKGEGPWELRKNDTDTGRGTRFEKNTSKQEQKEKET
jgi:hypothetical protein